MRNIQAQMSQPQKKPEKSALITGAAQRIGRAIALDLADKGWNIVIHCHNSVEAAGRLATEIESLGSKAIVVQCDLSSSDAAEIIFSRIAGELEPVTCLINNASVFQPDDINSVSAQSWALHLDVNLKAPVFLAQSFSRQLGKGVEGNIINLIDQRVWKLNPQFLSYTTSKAALWTLTRTLAQALAPEIRVNAIGPGPALPNKRQARADFDKQIAATLLKRGTNIREICRTIQFILETPAMTGQMIALDGGQHLAWRTPDVVGIKE